MNTFRSITLDAGWLAMPFANALTLNRTMNTSRTKANLMAAGFVLPALLKLDHHGLLEKRPLPRSFIYRNRARPAKASPTEEASHIVLGPGS
ncbi:hypothetical protein ACOSQ2_010333 [Xanthoceras sorbifolium]